MEENEIYYRLKIDIKYKSKEKQVPETMKTRALI